MVVGVEVAAGVILMTVVHHVTDREIVEIDSATHEDHQEEIAEDRLVIDNVEEEIEWGVETVSVAIAVVLAADQGAFK